MRVMTLRSPRVASSRVELRVGQVGAVQRGLRGKNGFVPRSESRRRQCPATKTKCGLMMESAPTSPLIVPQAKLLLEFFVIPLNDPSLFGNRHQCHQAGIRRKPARREDREPPRLRSCGRFPLLPFRLSLPGSVLFRYRSNLRSQRVGKLRPQLAVGAEAVFRGGLGVYGASHVVLEFSRYRETAGAG